MHRIAGLSVALLVAIMMMCTSSASMTGVNINSYGVVAPANEVLLPLHVSGQWIVDSSGNRIMLRGSGCAYNGYGNTAWLQQYITWLKETGCDFIRLAFIFPENGSWQSWSCPQLNIATLNQTVNLFGSNGIYSMMMDFDYYGNITYNGVTGPTILPTYVKTWINDWVMVANAFKNNPYVAIYELMNEGEYNAPVSWMQSAYANCTAAIRATGDNHIIMLWAGDYNTSSQLPSGGNIMLDWHQGNTFSDDTVRGNYKTWFPEDENLNDTTQYVAAELYASNAVSTILESEIACDCPVMMGEYTPYNYTMGTPDAYFLGFWVTMMEHYGISWEFWSFDSMIQNVYGSGGTTFWTTFFSRYLGGAFTSNYVSSSVPEVQTYNASSFVAYPFNLLTVVHASTAFLNYRCNYLGVSYLANDWYSNPGNYLSITGPCIVYVQCWGSTRAYWGNETYVHIYTLTSGQTLNMTTIGTSYGYTMAYSWANSPTYLPLLNS